MKVLVINAGSSSMKFTLYSMETETVLAKGVFERLGTIGPNLIFKRPDGFKFEQEIPVKDHVGAFNEICKKLVDPEIGVIKSLSEISAIGHRVLHGGEKITAPVIVEPFKEGTKVPSAFTVFSRLMENSSYSPTFSTML